MTLNTNLATQRSHKGGGPRRLITSFARPANATPYASGDIISDSTSATALGWDDADPSGVIVGASLIMGDTEAANLELLLFDEEPTNIADNAAIGLNAGDLTKIIGVFDFPTASKVNMGANKELYRADLEGMRYAFTSDSGQLYGLLVTRSIFTPASGGLFAINLHVE